MGAWDVTVFGNDDAADFSNEIGDASNRDQMIFRLTEAMEPAQSATAALDGYEASIALAAAAIVATWDHPELITEPSYMPDIWPPAGDPAPENLKEMARQTFARVSSEDENELADLWIEADNWDTFKTDIARYAAALS